MDLATAIKILAASAPILVELVEAIEAHQRGDDGADARLEAAIAQAKAHNRSADVAKQLDAELKALGG